MVKLWSSFGPAAVFREVDLNSEAMCRLLCCFDVARTVDLTATVDVMVAAFDDEPPEMLSSGVLLLRGDGTGLTLDKQVAGV